MPDLPTNPADSWDAAAAGAQPPGPMAAHEYLAWRYGYPSAQAPSAGYGYGGGANPWVEGLRLGALGSLLGLGWAGGYNALQKMRGRTSVQSGVVNPMILGALLGGGFGTLAGFDQRRRMTQPTETSAEWAEAGTRKDLARRRAMGLPPLYKPGSEKPKPWRKGAQFVGASGNLDGKTLQDLLDAIATDPRLGVYEKQRLTQQVLAMAGGADAGTPLASLLSGGLGGALGLLIGRYFSMGPIGQALAAAVGFGLGRTAWNYANRPPDPAPGWQFVE